MVVGPVEDLGVLLGAVEAVEGNGMLGGGALPAAAAFQVWISWLNRERPVQSWAPGGWRSREKGFAVGTDAHGQFPVAMLKWGLALSPFHMILRLVLRKPLDVGLVEDDAGVIGLNHLPDLTGVVGPAAVNVSSTAASPSSPRPRSRGRRVPSSSTRNS